MIKQNLYHYLTLGKIIRFFTSIAVFETNRDDFNRNIDYLYKYCSESWLKVSKLKLEEKIGQIAVTISDMPNNDILSDPIKQEIQDAMMECQNVIDIESKTKSIYELINPRLDIEMLVDRPLDFLTNTDKLNSLSKDDFENACKSLAYWLWTACWFHLMRVIENLTYEYAKKFWVIRGTNEMMHSILTRLQLPANRIKNKTKYDDKILQELDQIRKQYRNPTQHPDVTYTQSEIESLYYRCIAVINNILNKL